MAHRILVIDDAETACAFASMALGAQGYQVLTAADGRRGVQCAREQQPDLVLLDLVMPVLDGMGALAELRALPATAGIPVIVVTTQADLQHMEACYQLGCNDYIVKPYPADELVAKVTSLLGGAGAGQPGQEPACAAN